MTAGELDGADDGTVGDSTGAVGQRPWGAGDRVQVVGGPPGIVGGIGTVIGVGLPGPWPVRMRIENRPGFSVVQVAADEIVGAA